MQVGSITLHQHQVDSLECAYHAWDSGVAGALVQLPTGTGKTILMGAVADRHLRTRPRGVLLLAHRTELIEQAVEKFAFMGISCLIEQGLHSAQRTMSAMGLTLDAPVTVVGSVATMQNDRLRTWPRDMFGLIMVDEAHHIVAKSYGHILDHFRGHRLLGVTATSDRTDDRNIGQVFTAGSKPCYELPLRDAIDLDLLCEIEVHRVQSGVDLRGLKAATADSDLNMREVEERLLPHVERLVNIIAAEIGDKKTMLFAPNVRSAEAFASAFGSREIGIKAASVSDKDSRRNRSAIVRDFRQDHIQVMVNYGIFTEGFDEPSIEDIVIARPTTSRPLYSQMVGRGTRKHPGKTRCLVVDIAMISDKLNLVQPAELFDNSRLEPDIVAIAGRILAERGNMTLREAMDAAEQYKEHYRRLQLEVKAVHVNYRATSFDPMTFCDLGLCTYRKSDFTEDPRWQATDRQAKVLGNFGVSADGLSRNGAGRRIGVLLDRAKKKLAMPRQVLALGRMGVDPGTALEISAPKASELIGTLAQSRT